MLSDNDFIVPGKSQDKAIPRFYIKAVKNNFKSREEGRDFFEDKEWVKILVPGDTRCIVEREVTEEHKRRWPRQYAAWKKGVEYVGEGTPLKEWPMINPAQVEHFAQFNIYTVDQLAVVPDTQLQNFMGGFDMQKKARLWLEEAKGGAGVGKVIEENKRLALKNDDLERQLKDLSAKIDAVQAQASVAQPGQQTETSQALTPEAIQKMIADGIAAATANQSAAPAKRKRRTKAQIEADEAASAAKKAAG